jgi:hypothetical protein
MQKVITILIVLLSYTNSFYSQSQIDIELLKAEQEVFVAKTDSERAPLILKKVDLYIQYNETSINSLKEAQRIDYQLLPDDETKKRFLWNAAVLANLSNDMYYAAFYLDNYRKLCKDSSIQYLLLKILINNGEDSSILIQDTKALARHNPNFSCLTCLNEVAYYKKANKFIYLIPSILIPGLGSIMEGYPFKGAASLLVNTASVFAIYELVRHNLYINAVLWGFTLTTKFYLGNIKLTDKLFITREEKQKNALATKCKGSISNLLKEYPLLFK